MDAKGRIPSMPQFSKVRVDLAHPQRLTQLSYAKITKMQRKGSGLMMAAGLNPLALPETRPVARRIAPWCRLRN